MRLSNLSLQSKYLILKPAVEAYQLHLQFLALMEPDVIRPPSVFR